jgi:hypothetical protein
MVHHYINDLMECHCSLQTWIVCPISVAVLPSAKTLSEEGGGIPVSTRS